MRLAMTSPRMMATTMAIFTVVLRHQSHAATAGQEEIDLAPDADARDGGQAGEGGDDQGEGPAEAGGAGDEGERGAGEEGDTDGGREPGRARVLEVGRRLEPRLDDLRV